MSRITFVELKNFAAIYAGMRKKHIKLKLDNSHRIILLAGSNGSGKTAILSNLHPFASVGSLDVRNSEGLILEGEKGYKEIHIVVDEDEYVISHTYIPAKLSHTVKSFIRKNGNELNENGNVTSFKDILKMELNLEQDFLKLIRLGSNVTNLIDMKSTDRKNFTSDILSDVDIYSKFYKKVNEDLKVLKSLLVSVVNKIDKLRVSSKSDIEYAISSKEEEIDAVRTKKDNLNRKLWELQVDNVVVDISMLQACVVELSSIKKDRHKILKKLTKHRPMDLQRLESQLIQAEASKEAEESARKVTQNNLAMLYTRIEEYDKMLSSIRIEEEYEQTKQIKEELSVELAQAICVESPYRRDDLVTALSIMQSLDESLSLIYGFQSSIVTQVVGLKQNHESVDDYIDKQVRKIASMNNKINSDRARTNAWSMQTIMYTPKDCNPKGCPYYEAFNETSTKDGESTSSEKLERAREDITALDRVNRMINEIIKSINRNQGIISRLPKEIFEFNILDIIKRGEYVYSEDKVKFYIDQIDSFNEYQKKLSSLERLEKELSYMNKTQDTLDSLIKAKFNVNEEIRILTKKLEILDESIENANKSISLMIEDIEICKTYGELIREEESLSNRKRELEEYIEKSNTLIKDNEFNNKETDRVLIEIERVNELENSLLDTVSDYKYKLKDFVSLNEERQILEEHFDELEIVKTSLSSTKGLPLLFIKLFMEDIRFQLNDLLDIVYNGNLEILDFVVTDKEFNIPYSKDGIRVSDVRMSSQGERSFISIALSFAILKQSMDKYNVLLLDEIDATLDQKNRYLFISILEAQLDLINAEQCFLITHNNMFDNYPISLIKTSDVDIDNFKNVDIIKIN